LWVELPINACRQVEYAFIGNRRKKYSVLAEPCFCPMPGDHQDLRAVFGVIEQPPWPGDHLKGGGGPGGCWCSCARLGANQAVQREESACPPDVRRFRGYGLRLGDLR